VKSGSLPHSQSLLESIQSKDKKEEEGIEIEMNPE
jgi:hypothetical protein